MIENLSNRAIGAKPGKNPAAPSRNQDPSQLEKRGSGQKAKRAKRASDEGRG